MTGGLHRRQLLHFSGLGLAAIGLAPWIEQAFAWQARAQEDEPLRAPKPSPLSPRTRALSQAWTDAQKRGKPMLVLVVPLVHDRHERGTLLATYLQAASENAHAELALCEVACATVAELRGLLPAAEVRFEGEPLAVLVESDGKVARAVLQTIPAFPRPRGVYGSVPAEVDDRERWVDSIEQGFHAAIVGDRRALERRASEAFVHLSPTDRDRLVLLEKSGERWNAQDIALCPARALFAATTEDARRECAAELSRLSRSTVVERSPRGARWAERFGGCGGVKLQDPPEVVSSPGPCGTGFLPEESRRFLCFYSRSDG